MDSFESQVKEYKYLKDEIDKLTKDQKKLRDSLMAVIEEQGYEDDQGHWWLELDAEVDGVAALQRQRRVSRSLDEESAKETLMGLGLWEDCTELVRVVNEDKVYEALYEDKLSEQDVDAIYPQKITWALMLK